MPVLMKKTCNTCKHATWGMVVRDNVGRITAVAQEGFGHCRYPIDKPKIPSCAMTVTEMWWHSLRHNLTIAKDDGENCSCWLEKEQSNKGETTHGVN